MDVANTQSIGARTAEPSLIRSDPCTEHAAPHQHRYDTADDPGERTSIRKTVKLRVPCKALHRSIRRAEPDRNSAAIGRCSTIYGAPIPSIIHRDDTKSCRQIFKDVDSFDPYPNIPQNLTNLLKAANGTGNLQGGPYSVRLNRSVYSTLFVIVVVLNAVAIGVFWKVNLPSDLWITLRCDHEFLRTSLTAYMATAFSLNLTVCIILRHDHFINGLYRTLTRKTRSVPLWLRRHFASVYCMGGVHSGCATAALLWYVNMIAFAWVNRSNATASELQAMIVSVLVILVLLVIMVSSLPPIRNKQHNLFELTHRFGGWTLLILLWLQVLLPVMQQKADSADNMLVGSWWQSPPFWMLMLNTVLIIYPWIRLRRVEVQAEFLSNHAIRITMPISVRPCQTLKISHSPLIESHPFAAIPEPTEPGWSSIIVSRAGDWTSNLIDNTPLKIWIRETPTWGVIRVALLFGSVTVITTGSGIGPCLSLFVGHPEMRCRILWSTRNAEKTYGPGVLQLVHSTDPLATIIDTNQTGRLDMERMALAFHKTTGTEAVIVISNTPLTKKIVAAFVRRGIPAYGPIWDS